MSVIIRKRSPGEGDATDPFEVKAIQSYKPRKKNELGFKTDQVILVTKTNVKEFMYYGKLDGKEGKKNHF